MPPFEQVVAEHGATVLRVCRAVVGPVDAEDAWSETFLSALQAYPRLEPGSNVEAWLVTIAHRKGIDLVRARARRAVPVPAVPEPVGAGRDRAGGDLLGAGRGPSGEPDGELWAAVGALPPRQRLAVAYHYLAGLPHKDVAAIIGGTTDAARRAAADGIATLRRTVTPTGTPTRGGRP